MLSSKARDTFRHVTEPAGHALAKAGITANSLTGIGLAGSLGAGALIATGQPVVGGAVSLLSGLPDMLDGAVAKASGRVSRRGAFLDSVLDRFGDAAWINGGRPTEGFLKFGADGPFKGFYNDNAGAAWADWLFMIGLAGSLGAGALIATGQPVIGGAVSLLSGLPDMLDGAVAKASGRVSRRGAFLDSVVDRLSDAAVLAGVIWFALVRDLDAMAMLAGLVLSLSLVVSYIKGRAESLGFACNVGIAERPERVIVLGFDLLLGHAEAGLWVLVAGTAITVAQRIMVVWQQSDVGTGIDR